MIIIYDNIYVNYETEFQKFINSFCEFVSLSIRKGSYEHKFISKRYWNSISTPMEKAMNY